MRREQIKKYKLILLTIIITFVLSASAQNYSIYSKSKGVQVVTGGNTLEAKEGMPLKPNDLLIIPQGGTVAILDKISNNIFTSVSNGRISVAKLKIEAQRSATNKVGTILANVNTRFGGSGSKGGNRVYVEKGMINRSLAVFDSEGDTVAMEPSLLARYIASQILANKSDKMPVEIRFGEIGNNGLYFRLENTLEYPVYFNILRVNGSDVEISPLGHPYGTYIVLPNQVFQREHLTPIPDGEFHIIILTPCQYDLDTVIDEVNVHLKSNNPVITQDIGACLLFLNN